MEPEFQTAHAILTLAGKYVLQLRDDIPTISAPGQWSLFGGRVNDGETPEQAVRREVLEELEVSPDSYQALWPMDYYAPFERVIVRTWLFAAELGAVWSGHRLNEGREVKVFNYQELASLDMPPPMREAVNKYHQRKGPLGND